MAKKTVEAQEEGALVSAAKAIGKAAGKVAALAGAEAPAPAPKPSGRLVKKNKPHLPRRMKKAQKKAAAHL
jgi:hypothetical protein